MARSSKKSFVNRIVSKTTSIRDLILAGDTQKVQQKILRSDQKVNKIVKEKIEQKILATLTAEKDEDYELISKYTFINDNKSISFNNSQYYNKDRASDLDNNSYFAILGPNVISGTYFNHRFVIFKGQNAIDFLRDQAQLENTTDSRGHYKRYPDGSGEFRKNYLKYKRNDIWILYDNLNDIVYYNNYTGNNFIPTKKWYRPDILYKTSIELKVKTIENSGGSGSSGGSGGSGSGSNNGSGSGDGVAIGDTLLDIYLTELEKIIWDYSFSDGEGREAEFVNYLLKNNLNGNIVRSIDIDNLIYHSDENIIISFKNLGNIYPNPWWVNLNEGIINNNLLLNAENIDKNKISLPLNSATDDLSVDSAVYIYRSDGGGKTWFIKNQDGEYYIESGGLAIRRSNNPQDYPAKFINASYSRFYEVFENGSVYLGRYDTSNTPLRYKSYEDVNYWSLIVENIYKDLFFVNGSFISVIFQNGDLVVGHINTANGATNEVGNGPNTIGNLYILAGIDKDDIKNIILTGLSVSAAPLFMLLNNGDLYAYKYIDGNSVFTKIDENILQITVYQSTVYGIDIFYNLKKFESYTSAGTAFGNKKYRLIDGKYGVRYFGGPISKYFNGVYYLNEIATTLNENGTGYWNNHYYINGTQTTLNENGNGVWNNKYYENGILVTSSGDFTFDYVSGGIRITSWSGTETSLEIPSSILGVPVKRIGNQAFQNKSSLTSVTIPNSVTSIGDYAFSYCTGLTSITIPNSVTSMGAYIFLSCTELVSVDIEDSVADIGVGTFAYCNKLTNIKLPNALTSLKNDTFLGCGSLTNLIIPNSVIRIDGFNIFYETGLTSVFIPNSVTTIANFAFNGVVGLTSIILPQIFSTELSRISLTQQNLLVYYIGNDGLVRLNGDLYTGSVAGKYIINGVITTLNSSGTGGWNNQLYENGSVVTTYGNYNVAYENDGVTLSAYTGNETQIAIPNQILGVPIKKIGGYTFVNRTAISNITISNSVTSIGYGAFAGCSGLTNVTIPNSVTSIEYVAFENCINLASITLSNSLVSIGWGAFQNCNSLTSISIPNSLQSIGHSVFYSCDSLTEININSSNQYLTFIDGVLFDKNLTKLITYLKTNTLSTYNIPNSVTSIENQAFFNCSSLTSVSIPNSVTSIGEIAFYGCSGLTSVTIPNSVISIGSGAFSDCGGLTSVTIGNSVTSIGDYAFQGCSGLTSVVIPNSVISIGNYAFNGCSGLTSVTIPNSVTSIGEIAFYGCSGLTSITIPNSVTSIGDNAFTYAGLTSIILPQTFFTELSRIGINPNINITYT